MCASKRVCGRGSLVKIYQISGDEKSVDEKEREIKKEGWEEEGEGDKLGHSPPRAKILAIVLDSVP